MESSGVLDIFKTITTIPRESGHEEKITAWLLDWAAEKGLESKRDETGNVLVVKEASKGKESIPTIVLQAHQDMVCEKTAGCSHDFSKDPIPFIVKDGWMVSPETTLGADDGIGIAACLAALEDDKPKGRIECLFTISEETGMDGAFALKEGFFDGKTLINLDSEDEGQLFIGCAGGISTLVSFNMGESDADPSYETLKIQLSGGIGGHSGDDINKGRANVVQLMSRFLYEELSYGLQLFSFNGGGKHNAIARDCAAVIAVPDPSGTIERLKAFTRELKEEFHVTDPGLESSAVPEKVLGKPFNDEITGRLITAVHACPHGMYAMSQDIADLVQTSTNLASVKTSENGIVRIVTSQRSSSVGERRAMASKVRAVFELAGAEVEYTDEYPGWNPDINSPILKKCVESYRRLFNSEPEVKAIHAGLECGLFLEKFPGLDMISFGPTLRGVHAPGEKMDLDSLDKFVILLDDIICNF